MKRVQHIAHLGQRAGAKLQRPGMARTVIEEGDGNLDKVADMHRAGQGLRPRDPTGIAEIIPIIACIEVNAVADEGVERVVIGAVIARAVGGHGGGPGFRQVVFGRGQQVRLLVERKFREILGAAALENRRSVRHPFAMKMELGLVTV